MAKKRESEKRDTRGKRRGRAQEEVAVVEVEDKSRKTGEVVVEVEEEVGEA